MAPDNWRHDTRLSCPQQNPRPRGLRLRGTYSGQGTFQIEFSIDSATMDCGQVHVVQPYIIENRGNQLLIAVKNGTAPFTLALQPDGTLSGSRIVEVAGRMAVGRNGNGVVYAPRNVWCPLGTLVAK